MAQSFEQAKQAWKAHHCQSEAFICDCRFDFHCESCGVVIAAHGEIMEAYIGTKGLCESCFYRPDDPRVTPDESFDAYMMRTGAALELAQADLEWQAEQGYDGLDSEQLEQIQRSWANAPATAQAGEGD